MNHELCEACGSPALTGSQWCEPCDRQLSTVQRKAMSRLRAYIDEQIPTCSNITHEDLRSLEKRIREKLEYLDKRIIEASRGGVFEKNW